MKTKNEILLQEIRKAQKGEKTGFQNIYNLYYEKILRYAFHFVRNANLAEDLTHDTFVKVFKNINSLKEQEKFNSWIYLIAKRTFMEHQRRKTNKPHEGYDELENGIGVDFKSNDRLKAINLALDTLDAEEKNAILLVDLGENSYEEASEIMSMTLDRFKSRIRIARKKFIEYYKSNNIEVTGIFELPKPKAN